MERTIVGNRGLVWRSDLRQATEWAIRDARRLGLECAMICVPQCPDRVRGGAVDAAERAIRSGVARSATACLHDGGLIIIAHVPSQDSAHALASRVRWAVQDAGVGVGIAFADESIEELADAAAKLEHDCEAAARGANPGEIIGGGARQTGSALMEALREEKLRLWYQPIVRIEDGSMVGAEALCRWEPNEGGAVSADRFWEMAVEHGIERDITMWALRRAVTETQQLVEKRDIQIHVNCSLTQVDDPTFPDAILEAVNGVTPGHVVLEIVENGAREISQRMAANLRLVRGMGVKTALDDFGSGWSGLSRLSNLEWDYVKIDRSLCHRVSQKTRQQACARAAIQVATECGALVVAEGVEHQDDADMLASLGALYGQGYLWSRPGPVRVIA